MTRQKETETQKSSKKQKKTDRVGVYLVRLRGGGGLRGRRGVWLSVGILRRGLVVLIGSIGGRDNRPCCLNRSWSVGCRHCMSNSGGRLDTVGGRRGVGVGWGRLSTAGGRSKLRWRVALKKFVTGQHCCNSSISKSLLALLICKLKQLQTN